MDNKPNRKMSDTNDILKPGKSVNSDRLLNRTHIVNIPTLEADLGIYDDVGDCDGLSDTELVEPDGDPKVKTPRRETSLAEKTRMTPVPILRKSSQLINSSNAPDWASSQRPIQYTPRTYSRLDDQASNVTWSSYTKQPIGVYISTRKLPSGTSGKPNTPASRLASRMTNPSAESRLVKLMLRF